MTRLKTLSVFINSPRISVFTVMFTVSPLPRFASNISEKSWKNSLFGRRRSVPQVRPSFLSKRGSQSSVGEEDTLCSEHTLSDPGEFVMDGEDYDLCSSFGIINNQVVDIPFGQDQLVASTQAKQPFIDTQLHRPKNAQVREHVCVCVCLLEEVLICWP